MSSAHWTRFKDWADRKTEVIGAVSPMQDEKKLNIDILMEKESAIMFGILMDATGYGVRFRDGSTYVMFSDPLLDELRSSGSKTVTVNIACDVSDPENIQTIKDTIKVVESHPKLLRSKEWFDTHKSPS
jgi:hypothetical protein